MIEFFEFVEIVTESGLRYYHRQVDLYSQSYIDIVSQLLFKHKYYKTVIALCKDNAILYLYKSMAHNYMGEHKDAYRSLVDMAEIIQADQVNPMVNIYLSTRQKLKDDPGFAELHEVIDQSHIGSYSLYWLFSQIAYHLTKLEPENSIIYYQRSLDQLHQFTIMDLDKAYVHEMMGDIYSDLVDINKAIKHYMLACEFDNDRIVRFDPYREYERRHHEEYYDNPERELAFFFHYNDMEYY